MGVKDTTSVRVVEWIPAAMLVGDGLREGIVFLVPDPNLAGHSAVVALAVE